MSTSKKQTVKMLPFELATYKIKELTERSKAIYKVAEFSTALCRGFQNDDGGLSEAELNKVVENEISMLRTLLKEIVMDEIELLKILDVWHGSELNDLVETYLIARESADVRSEILRLISEYTTLAS